MPVLSSAHPVPPTNRLDKKAPKRVAKSGCHLIYHLICLILG